jgi:hypothetical protein
VYTEQVLSRRDDPFPLEAVRDLLGLMRSLYAAQKEAGASPADLEALARAGKDLQEALSLAASSRPGTLGYAAAWKRAEDATARAGGLVEEAMSAQPVVKAAVGRIVGKHRTA